MFIKLALLTKNLYNLEAKISCRKNWDFRHKKIVWYEVLFRQKKFLPVDGYNFGCLVKDFILTNRTLYVVQLLEIILTFSQLFDLLWWFTMIYYDDNNTFYGVYLGTAPWGLNFAYFLVTRTTFYALSDGSHKKNKKCLKSAKIWG